MNDTVARIVSNLNLLIADPTKGLQDLNVEDLGVLADEAIAKQVTAQIKFSKPFADTLHVRAREILLRIERQKVDNEAIGVILYAPPMNVVWGELQVPNPSKTDVHRMDLKQLAAALPPTHWPLDADEEKYMQGWESIVNSESVVDK